MSTTSTLDNPRHTCETLKPWFSRFVILSCWNLLLGELDMMGHGKHDANVSFFTMSFVSCGALVWILRAAA